jgi:hypothetical protein
MSVKLGVHSLYNKPVIHRVQKRFLQPWNPNPAPKFNWYLLIGLIGIGYGCYMTYNGLSEGGLVITRADMQNRELLRLIGLSTIHPSNLLFDVLSLSNRQLHDAATISRFYQSIPIRESIELVNYLQNTGQYDLVNDFVSHAVLQADFGLTAEQLNSDVLLRELRAILVEYDVRFNINLPGNGKTVQQAFIELVSRLTHPR